MEQTVCSETSAYIIQTQKKIYNNHRSLLIACEQDQDGTEFNFDPADFHSDPAEFHSDPAEFHSDPAEFRSDPAEFRSDPAEFRSDPAEFRSDPAEFRSKNKFEKLMHVVGSIIRNFSTRLLVLQSNSQGSLNCTILILTHKLFFQSFCY
jgi:hypothetical protein